jgi:hypothetical protein
MLDTEIKTLLDQAADPHLIASAAKANELMWRLNALVTDLRMEVRDLELGANIELNRILKTDIAIERGKSEWKVSEIYKEWKKKAGLLADVRSVRKAMQRHADILFEQEKYSSKYENKAYLG